MVNDGTFDIPSYSADYYQFSNVISRGELNYKRSKIYVSHQIKLSEKTSFLFQFTFLQFRDKYRLQIPILLKVQTLLHQKVRLFAMQHIFINEMVTFRNSFKNLYTA